MRLRTTAEADRVWTGDGGIVTGEWAERQVSQEM